MTVREIAAFLEGDVVGDEKCSIGGLAKIEEAKAGDLSFVSNPKYEKYLEATSASAVIVSRSLDLSRFAKLPPAVIKVTEPYGSFVVALERFHPKTEKIASGIDSTAIIANSAVIGKQCAVGSFVVVGEGCFIGNSTTIYPNTVIGNRVKIGNDCTVYANVTIREECEIGNRVIIQPGAVIGSDGFGFAPKKDGSYQKIPQLGIVVIEDDVEIGANTCVDRATMGETRIKRGAKLDNLIQVAHNVTIGENTVIAGQTGIAGSTKIGNNVMIAGNVGIAGHLVISDRVMIGAQSGISKSLMKEGEAYFGTPAKELSKAKRIEAASRQLPELLVTIRQLQQRIEDLEKKLHP
jgi:UDP-3-O-[3-hydroxymyristoyl] glucosamine N-acyltransferase